MEPLRFLHAADFHLDSPLRGLRRYAGAPVERIRQASRRALENLVAYAIEQRLQMVLIAGDVYDGDWQDHNTGLFFVHQLVRLREAGIRVYMIRGNHDAASRITQALSFPQNFDDTPMMLSHQRAETINIPDLRVAIHGRGFADQAESQNLVDEYPQAVAGHLNIGLLHTSLDGLEGHSRYAPCTVNQLRHRGYQYWALGHIHQHLVFPDQRQMMDPWIVFSGCLQGRHVRELGAKGAVEVTCRQNQVESIAFRPFDVLRWHSIDVDVSSCTAESEMVAAIRSQLEPTLESAENRLVALRVRLTGATELHQAITTQPERWENQVRAWAMEVSAEQVWVERVVLATNPQSKAVDWGEFDPIADIERIISEMAQDDEAISELLAEYSPLWRKLGGEVQPRDGDAWNRGESLRALLPEVQSLLLGRLSSGFAFDEGTREVSGEPMVGTAESRVTGTRETGTREAHAGSGNSTEVSSAEHVTGRPAAGEQDAH